MPKHYDIVVSNPYLGKSRVIRGTNKREVQFLANEQLRAWSLEEAHKRQQDYQRALREQAHLQQQQARTQAQWQQSQWHAQQQQAKAQAQWEQQEAKRQQQAAKQQEQDQMKELADQAEQSNNQAREQHAALRELLIRGLDAGERFDWNTLKNNASYPVAFQFIEQPPTYEQVAQMLQVPAPRATEALFPEQRRRREALELEARNRLYMFMTQYEARRSEAFRCYEEQRLAYERERSQQNALVDEKRQRLAEGDSEEIAWFLKTVLAGINFPEGYGQEVEVAFDPPSGTAIVEMWLPNPTDVPKIIAYNFVKSRKATEPVEMKPKGFEPFYDSVIQQMALLTIHRCFRDVITPALQAVVFNGWVRGIDRATGKRFTSCILSVRMQRESFQAMNWGLIDPKECIKSLGAMMASSLAHLVPVPPVMKLDTKDKRFVESREVLDHLSEDENLATMDWEDFEHLVRELFSKIFSGENAEVRVTQSSRDGGVDAIVFDPDPLRGGKYVIQAKRYNHVVPFSAVRDLHGTMDHERATRGFLVTTSNFGNDSREFVKDKPSITLIDGSNLVALLQQYGYTNVRVELQY